MLTLLKGLLVLPLVAVIVGMIWIAGSVIFAVVGFVVMSLCILVPLIFKAMVIGSVALGLLWGLGKASSEILGAMLSRSVKA